MPPRSGLGLTVFCLLLIWKKPTASSDDTQCSVAPTGAQHPVQALLERFEAGPGCTARESGNKETHVIAVGRVTNSQDNTVTVLLKPLSPPLSPLRAIHLLLSSKLPINWWLEAERLPADLPVLVQLPQNSRVRSHSLRLHVQPVHSLPFHARTLHHWALKHHGNISSLTHVMHGNRVYVRLGEDTTLPSMCRLQSTHLSQNYMVSDLQPQEVQGCTTKDAAGSDPEVHVIKLHSVGSGLCGSLQVEVIVSLVPPVRPKAQRVILILSSSVPVNWAIVAHGVRGQIFVHSSNSVSPPYPPEPELTLSSSLISDLSAIRDLLVWASESYDEVASYTEADLANRFVIRLAGGGTEVSAAINPMVGRLPWGEERRLREWLNGGGKARGGRDSFTVKCEGGRLSVTLDQHILQRLSIPVAAVTLQDTTCQGRSNGSHFLLVFPVISCGTEGMLLGRAKGVQYKNMVLLWRDKPARNETETTSRRPLGLHFSCLATVQPQDDDDDDDDDDGDDDDNVNATRIVMDPRGPVVEVPNPGLNHLPTLKRRSGPALVMRLFVSESYVRKRVGPCVMTADQRVYVEISAEGAFIDRAEVKSCVVSPQSDPKNLPFWKVISEGCSEDPSLALVPIKRGGEEEAELEEDRRTTGEPVKGEGYEEPDAGGEGDSPRHQTGRQGRNTPAKTGTNGTAVEDVTRSLRFSFILRPVYNVSVQFLHCSLHLCVSDAAGGKQTEEVLGGDCQVGTKIPPLVPGSPGSQCETRNLSRPMVVTRSISSLVSKVQKASSGQRIKRLSVAPVGRPEQEQSGSVIQTGPLMGIVFASFVLGASLMAGLWCIHCHTGAHSASRGGHLTDRTCRGQPVWSPPSPSDHSSSSV